MVSPAMIGFAALDVVILAEGLCALRYHRKDEDDPGERRS
jgi:hypothetical protein